MTAEPCTDALCPATFEHIHVTKDDSPYRADKEVREQIVSLTGYAPESRTVQAFMEVISAAEARARTEVVAKVEALAAECASMAATLHDVRAADAFASVEIDLRALIVRASA